jgi:hypothetical protein
MHSFFLLSVLLLLVVLLCSLAFFAHQQEIVNSEQPSNGVPVKSGKKNLTGGELVLRSTPGNRYYYDFGPRQGNRDPGLLGIP